MFGHGTPTRDYVHVADVVGALIAANGTRGTFNVATGVETDVLTLWNVLKAAAGSDIEPELAELRAGELKRSCLDTSHTASALGWRAQVPVEQGLRETYAALVEEFERAVT
jgi:UDP-glucose 4-epimerase